MNTKKPISVFGSILARLAVVFFLTTLFLGCMGQTNARNKPGKTFQEVFYAQTSNHQAPDDKTGVEHIPGDLGEEIYAETRDSKSFAEQLGDFIVESAKKD